MYVWTIIIHIICEWHAEAGDAGAGGGRRGEEGYSLHLNNGKSGWGILTPFYIKKKVIIFQNNCIVSAGIITTPVVSSLS